MGKRYDKYLKVILNKSHSKLFTLIDSDRLGDVMAIYNRCQYLPEKGKRSQCGSNI